jgi:hypothetical protein
MPRTLKITVNDGREQVVEVADGRNAHTRAMAITTLRLRGEAVTYTELIDGQWKPYTYDADPERVEALAAQGFAMGDRVEILEDGNERVPAHVRPAAGDQGTVILNMAHGPELVGVRVDDKMTHALSPDAIRKV